MFKQEINQQHEILLLKGAETPQCDPIRQSLVVSDKKYEVANLLLLSGIYKDKTGYLFGSRKCLQKPKNLFASEIKCFCAK